MILQLIIGVATCLYLIWKYLLSNKREQLTITQQSEAKDIKTQAKPKDLINHDNVEKKESFIDYSQKEEHKNTSQIIAEEPSKDNSIEKKKLIPPFDDSTFNSVKHEPLIVSSKPILPEIQWGLQGEFKTNGVKDFSASKKLIDDIFTSYDNKTPKEPLVENEGITSVFSNTFNADIQGVPKITPIELNDVITPSQLLQRQKEKIIEKPIPKRESPPKERLTEFLEKTVLCDDKIQSIIHNLSLDKTDEPKAEFDVLKESLIHNKVKPVKSEKALRFQESIDEIADKFKQLSKDVKVNEVSQAETKQEEVVEEKPLLKRLQKQPGFPSGLNFGSVIGELKNKTKNGGLKPVFKKFDPDSDYNAQESLNAAVDEKKKVQIEDNELGENILADRRNKLETAAQGWRKRVPQSDASLFTVAGRLERDKVATATPPLTPPPVATPPAAVASPGVPAPNTFRSRKQPSSPPNGFPSGPLRSASCAVVSAAAVEKPKEPARPDRESFKRSHSVSESISSRLEEKDEGSPGAEKTGCAVRVPRADDETFHAFFAPLQQQERTHDLGGDVDLDAIDSGSRQLLASDWARRAKRERRHAASRNPLKALAARTDLREEYVAPPSTIREQLFKEKVTANCGLAAEALAALATKEDFSNVALRSASAACVPAHGAKPTMLLQVKGRRRVQTRLVEPVHTNVNRGDCFVLTTPDQVYLYIGLYANVIERNRSTDIALHIHNTKDLGCKSTGVVKIDEQTKNYSNKHWNQFWSLLGITEAVEDYKPVETGHADEDEIYESCIVQTNMCYEVMDDELVPIEEYWGQMPKIAMLHQTKIIVFDFGSEMYIWYGKNVPLESRRRAAQLAQELFDEGYNYEECHINPLNAAMYQGARDLETNGVIKTSKSRPEWAILSKITQHMETILFKEKFLDWPDYSRVIKIKAPENKSSSTEITPCDAEEMWSNEYQDPDLILEGSHIGRGTNYYDKENMRHYDIKTKSVCKWVIQEYDFQKVENDAEIGEFFSGDSYIIRWEYQITVTGRELNGKPSKHNVTGRDRCAYFCWQGKDASSNEKGAAALLTVELDREKGPQVRVAQGNEPPAFLNLFQGNLIIHQGKRDTDKSRYRLFVTRGNLSNEAYLLQVPCSVRQLRSRGSLLLVDTEKGCLYIWHGARSLKHTKNIAIELANKLIARKSGYLFGLNASDVKITEVKEGEEPKEVLEALGVANKQYYNSVLGGGRDVGGDTTARLFHFTDLSGQFEANEMLSPLRHEHLVTPFPFEQKELYSASQPALFLLDDGSNVWLWQGWWPRGEDGELEPAERNAGVGAFAGRWQGMRAAALRTCEAYWRVGRPDAGPDARPDVRVVAAGLEPQSFTNLFDTWREHDEAADANIAHGYKAGAVLSGACELSRLSASGALLPLAALQRRPLPDHVDAMHLERHLAPHDFQEAFGMTKEEFSALPAWKQTSLKKDVGLF
ncbi:supervillin isoform X1 [Ostrinia furnacalis]|uniref:supervillin isoform X1 n=1 Tax=Ostrinia furnacalis TaxID=93504 RepID=UPI00103C8596|nr:supervillin isoform X1 [Ostrinia furnacalis]XP_028168520.1 supervillin isoform X1 [Ostrinia furnacalis]